MNRTETATLTMMCMVYQGDKILVQDRSNRNVYKGIAFPGGHVEQGESFIQATIREMQEETGLTVKNLQLCGIKQFTRGDCGRYMVLIYKTDCFSGELCSSEEGEMLWLTREEIATRECVYDFWQVLKILDGEEYNELYYQEGSNIPTVY